MGELGSNIQYLSGVGPKRAALLKSELGIETLNDLIHFYPFRYIDRTRVVPIAQVQPDLAYVQIKATVIKADEVPHKRLSVTVEDESGRMELVFFKGINWNKSRLIPGSSFIFFGKPQTFSGKINMVHPEIDPVPEGPVQGGLTGVYPSTEKLKNSGITGKVMCKLMATALSLCLPEIEETLPEYVLSENALCPLSYAIRNIHFPKDEYALQKSQRRLKFEELFLLQLSLLKQRYVRTSASRGIPMTAVGDAFRACYNALPYPLTGAQQRVVKEIRADLMSGHQMNRLLQGDVGSGKTLVAVLSCLLATGNGYQACIMAPTEVLAQQHYVNIQKFLSPCGVRSALLTGSSTAKERREIDAGLRDGSIGIIVGTHALIEDSVVFSSLGLCVIDEQHRFGVDQRSRLWSKSAVPPHILVMTATPIPRTLAMTLYGDLDISILDEMPPGRKPVQTMLITPHRKSAMYDFIRKQIAAGRQAFIVYPMIFENEKMDISNVEQGYEEIMKEFPLPQYRVAIVHGQQTSETKAFNMDAFAAGRADILVSTTVIEVGVDVPNASVMVIESAERFGLSQLHQLRGRVGRGAEKSYCIMVGGPKISSDARNRLQLMVETEDGFRIAEEDMRMRGPGDLEGTQQSGLPIELSIASLARDGILLSEARAYAQSVLEKDPGLNDKRNSLLVRELRKNKYNVKDYSAIS